MTAPTITTVSPLPDGVVGEPYNVQLSAEGGDGTYTWRLLMATYTELYALHSGQDELLHKVAVATWVAAETIRAEVDTTPNHANRMAWAARVLSGGLTDADQMLRALLAANRAVTPAQILGATDAAIQSKVDDAIDLVAGV